MATALFVDLGGGRLTLVHRSLAEYLAARYLAHHHMDAEQIMSLLASADDPDGRLIPQLREVAAWTATLDEDALDEVMTREPEVLLRVDRLTFTKEARARLVSSLLTEDTAMRVERYDRRIRRAFVGLVHPGLPDQIREALRPGHSIRVRQMAFTLAQAAALPELQHDLVAFAFNTTEPEFLRDDAVWALKDYGRRPDPLRARTAGYRAHRGRRGRRDQGPGARGDVSVPARCRRGAEDPHAGSQRALARRLQDVRIADVP